MDQLANTKEPSIGIERDFSLRGWISTQGQNIFKIMDSFSFFNCIKYWIHWRHALELKK